MKSLPAWGCLVLVAALGCSIDKSGIAAPDAGCVARGEACNGVDDDCDGTVDEDFDLGGDLENCGSCDNACPADPNNAAPSCTAGECRLTCDPGFENCNDSLADGCEAVLSEPSNCGGCNTSCGADAPLCQRNPDDSYACVANCAAGLTQCGTSCIDTADDLLHCGACDNACPMLPNSTPTCNAGTCSFACDGDFEDCNGVATDGCEVNPQSDHANCGACGNTCDLMRATASCVAGTCRIASCNSRYENCNRMDADGCEVDTANDPLNCRGCGNACNLTNASASCSAGSCQIASCDPGFDDCNGMTSDGCEIAVDADVANCGGCGNACNLPRTDTHTCFGGSCRVSTCDPGYDNCNGMHPDGCEVRTDTDASNCGGCGTTCNLPGTNTHTCSGGTCQVSTCDTGFDDCNGMDPDGCEANLASDATCGNCTTSCGAGQSCMGGMCAGCPGGCNCLDTDCRTGGNSCSCNSGCTCDFECSRNCDVICNGTCTTTTTDTGINADYTCNSGGTCTFGARNASNVDIICNGGSTCVIDCTDTSNCDQIICQGSGVDCQIDCTGSGNCDFSMCTGMERTCPGNIRVCNPTGACP